MRLVDWLPYGLTYDSILVRCRYVAVVYHTDVVAKTLSHRPFCPYHRFSLLDLFARTVLMFCHQDTVLDQIRQSSDYAILIGDWTEVTVLAFQWTIFQSHALYTDNNFYVWCEFSLVFQRFRQSGTCCHFSHLSTRFFKFRILFEVYLENLHIICYFLRNEN